MVGVQEALKLGVRHLAFDASLLASTSTILQPRAARGYLCTASRAVRASHHPSSRLSLPMSLTSSPKPPLVAVVGTTGVGKSLLGVELARALADGAPINGIHRGEVLNTDSMQVYRGLDVITNKATAEEMNGVPHHLMGFLSPGEEYRVGEFQSDALAKVSLLAPPPPLRKLTRLLVRRLKSSSRRERSLLL